MLWRKWSSVNTSWCVFCGDGRRTIFLLTVPSSLGVSVWEESVADLWAEKVVFFSLEALNEWFGRKLLSCLTM